MQMKAVPTKCSLNFFLPKKKLLKLPQFFWPFLHLIDNDAQEGSCVKLFFNFMPEFFSTMLT